jgi:AcrR family transcriptional regulator
VPNATFDLTTPEGRVLAAAVHCVDKWGIAKVTVDDIATEAGISRATLYRLFPGGKDVLFEAIRQTETLAFFADLDVHVQASDTLEELVVGILVEATVALRTDDRLQMMLAARPGEVLASIGFADQPRIIAAASAFLQPRVSPRRLDGPRGALLLLHPFGSCRSGRHQVGTVVRKGVCPPRIFD